MKVKIKHMGRTAPLVEHDLTDDEEIELEWGDGTRLRVSKPQSEFEMDVIDIRSVGRSGQLTVASVAANRVEVGLR